MSDIAALRAWLENEVDAGDEAVQVWADKARSIEEQLEALQAAVDDAALVFVDTMWFNAYNHLSSTANASLNNRCDRPGCLSRATSGYIVGLGGMVAYYCVDHAPASSPASESDD